MTNNLRARSKNLLFESSVHPKVALNSSKRDLSCHAKISVTTTYPVFADVSLSFPVARVQSCAVDTCCAVLLPDQRAGILALKRALTSSHIQVFLLSGNFVFVINTLVVRPLLAKA